RLRTAGDQDPAVGSLEQAPVLKRRQDKDRPSVTELAERDDRLLLLGEGVGAEGGDKRREIIRVGGWRCRKQEEQDRGKPYDANPHPLRSAQPPLPHSGRGGALAPAL